MPNQDHRAVNTSQFRTLKNYTAYQMQPYQNLGIETVFGVSGGATGYRFNTQDNNYALTRDLNSDAAQLANIKMCKK